MLVDLIFSIVAWHGFSFFYSVCMVAGTKLLLSTFSLNLALT